MRSIRSISPLLRAIFVIGAVAALVTGITFAALSDTASLTGNTISSDTADLEVSNGGAFNDVSVVGFTADDIVPGVGETFDFFLRNSSDFNMNVTAHVDGDCADYIEGNLGIPNCGDVLITFDDYDGGDATTWTLQQLINGPKDLPNNPLDSGAQIPGPAATGVEGHYTVNFDLDADDISGSSATLNNPFNIVFTGTQTL